MSSSATTGRLSARFHRDYSPISWSEYFDEAHDLQIDNNNNQSIDSFRVYLKNFNEPYAPKRNIGQLYLDSNLNDKNEVTLTTKTPTTYDSKRLSDENLSTNKQLELYSKVPTLVTLHGGGYSALTWAQFSRHIDEHCQCRILAIDLRGHGDSKTFDDNQMDINTLVQDVISVTHELHRLCGFQETPKIVVIGHSMGGAIAVKCASKCVELLPSLAGFVVIDVVEGTAKDALPQMLNVIRTRPTKFPSLSNAIEWSVRSGMAKNSEAARVSMPGNLVNISTGHLAIHDIIDDDSTKTSTIDTPIYDKTEKRKSQTNLKKHKFHISVDQLIGPGPPQALLHNLPTLPRIAALKSLGSFSHHKQQQEEKVLTEEKEEDTEQKQNKIMDNAERLEEEVKEEREKTTNDCYKLPPDVEVSGYSWRTNLAKTQPFWNDWFEGLSSEMLSAPVQGKFLLLAGIDRLDKTLTIGQMQGKFMMKVLPKCGHAVHEDVPEQVALAIGDFLIRNKFTSEPSFEKL